VHASLLALQGDEKLLQECTWLAYAYDGLRGLAGLLCRSRGGQGAGHVAVRSAVAWTVYELVRSDFNEVGAQQRPETASILAILVEAMGHENASPQAQWACCAALDAMVKLQAQLASVFIEQGGGPLLARALGAANAMGADGKEFRRAAAYLVTSLAESSVRAADALRNEGAVCLLATMGLQGSGLDTDAALWALGVLGGVRVVLETMSRDCSDRPRLLCAGLKSICECADQAAGDCEELKGLPAALLLAMELAGQDGEVGLACLLESTHAVGTITVSLAPHAPPGSVCDIDRAVETLLKRLHTTPLLRQTDCLGGEGRRGDGGYTDRLLISVAEAAAEAIGRIALVSSDWREALRRCGTLDALRGWIGLSASSRQLQKYLFWAAGAIAGLPFVVLELRSHMKSEEVVNAALCTVAHILDDDVTAEYALVGVERCSDGDVPALLSLVIEAMRMHGGAPEVQARACCCVGLLLSAQPLPGLPTLAAGAVSALLTAARRFPWRSDVIKGAGSALRVLCSWPVPCCGDGDTASAVATALRDEGAADCLSQMLDAFAQDSRESELLEDTAAALALIRGVEEVLQRLERAGPGSPLRAAGLKALFEVARCDLSLLAGQASAAAAAACFRMVQEEPVQGARRLHEAAALLSGLCGRAPQSMGGA